MTDRELLEALKNIERQIKQGKPCEYHKDLEKQINKALTETTTIRTEYIEANKRLADILGRIEKRLDNGDRNFDNLENDIQEIKERIIKIETEGKLKADWLARGISIIMVIIVAMQLLYSIVH